MGRIAERTQSEILSTDEGRPASIGKGNERLAQSFERDRSRAQNGLSNAKLRESDSGSAETCLGGQRSSKSFRPNWRRLSSFLSKPKSATAHRHRKRDVWLRLNWVAL